MMKWEEIRENVYPFLIWTEKNQKLLSVLSHRSFLDLSVGYMIKKKSLALGNMSVRVTKQLERHWGITEETLHAQAMENLKKETYQFKTMGEILAETCGDASADQGDMDDESFLVVTNQDMWYGAAALLLGGDFFRQVLGTRDYYILPSSIHELLLTPAKGPWSLEKVNQMVREVNREQLCEKERLNDHVYCYNGRTGEIGIP